MIVLASASPRRKELLSLITTDFVIQVADVDETMTGEHSPAGYVECLAQRKAAAVLAVRPADTIIGSDTVVVLDGQILGKPTDTADAKRMLTALSGRGHHVYTGVAILRDRKEEVFSVGTQVEFYPMTEQEIDDYVATGDPMDKAGAYGIQGFASQFVKTIQGDYFTIVGLPVGALYQKLKKW